MESIPYVSAFVASQPYLFCWSGGGTLCRPSGSVVMSRVLKANYN